MKVERGADGTITCSETTGAHRKVTCWQDGRCLETSNTGRPRESIGVSFVALREPRVAFAIPGERLVDTTVPSYDWELDHGATVQVCASEVLAQPHRVALQLVLVPRGQEPPHHETVGDRRIDEGVPDLWIVLDLPPEPPPRRLAAVQRLPHLPKPLHVRTEPPYDPFDP
jgi:hypothetical protein